MNRQRKTKRATDVKTAAREFWLGVSAFACFVMFVQMQALASGLYHAKFYYAAGVTGVSALAWLVAVYYLVIRAYNIGE
jgi:hypothetical protein